jgi:hypothetical protein
MGSVVDIYHGTSTYFARKLIRGVSGSPIIAAGALDCAAELHEQLVRVAGSTYEAANLYPRDSSTGTWAPLALENARSGNQESLMAYGNLYGSLSPTIAASYAANNPHGSELLRAIAVTIDALFEIDRDIAPKLLTKYPHIADILNSAHRPVVLQLKSIPIERLQEENGAIFTLESLVRRVDRQGVESASLSQ